MQYKILVVANQNEMVALYREILAQENYTIKYLLDEAAFLTKQWSSQELIDNIKEFQPHLVVYDISHLPNEIIFCNFLKGIRSIFHGSGIPRNMVITPLYEYINYCNDLIDSFQMYPPIPAYLIKAVEDLLHK